jgi:hypothetical protein
VSAYDHGIDAPDYHGGIYRVDVETAEAQMLVMLPREPVWWQGVASATSLDDASLFYLLEGLPKPAGGAAESG